MSKPRIEWRSWSGLQALYLGDIIVARVAPDGGRKNKPRAIFNLAAVDGGAFWFDCATVEEAREQIEARLDRWLRRAGLQ